DAVGGHEALPPADRRAELVEHVTGSGGDRSQRIGVEGAGAGEPAFDDIGPHGVSSRLVVDRWSVGGGRPPGTRKAHSAGPTGQSSRPNRIASPKPSSGVTVRSRTNPPQRRAGDR